MDFNTQLQEKVRDINALLGTYLPEVSGFQKTIMDAMNYSVEAGGKRLRPMLMEETFRLFGGEGSLVQPFMAAMEMIHTYSLVHDDLPAMDNDMYRRGKLTTHAKYGEAMAILAGDALLNYAFETASQAFDQAKTIEEYKRVAKALQILSRRAGIYGMIGGQVVDVEAEKKQEEIDRARLDFIYELKTGALLEASMEIGAVLAGASEEALSVITEVASKTGLAFQIMDDILDVTSTQEELGKPIGSDARNEKVTYVTYEGLEKSQEDVERLSNEAVACFKGIDGDSAFLTELILSLVHRKK